MIKACEKPFYRNIRVVLGKKYTLHKLGLTFPSICSLVMYPIKGQWIKPWLCDRNRPPFLPILSNWSQFYGRCRVDAYKLRQLLLVFFLVFFFHFFKWIPKNWSFLINFDISLWTETVSYYGLYTIFKVLTFSYSQASHNEEISPILSTGLWFHIRAPISRRSSNWIVFDCAWIRVFFCYVLSELLPSFCFKSLVSRFAFAEILLIETCLRPCSF